MEDIINAVIKSPAIKNTVLAESFCKLMTLDTDDIANYNAVCRVRRSYVSSSTSVPKIDKVLLLDQPVNCSFLAEFKAIHAPADMLIDY